MKEGEKFDKAMEDERDRVHNKRLFFAYLLTFLFIAGDHAKR